MDMTLIAGIAASMCTMLSLLPQLIKMIRTKKSGDVSYLMLLVLFAGNILWIIYGILREDWIILVSNSISTLINIVNGFFSMKYRPRDAKLSELA